MISRNDVISIIDIYYLTSLYYTNSRKRKNIISGYFKTIENNQPKITYMKPEKIQNG